MNIDWINLHRDTVTHPGMWDDTFLRELLAGVHGPIDTGGTVAVVPGRYHADDVDEINRQISRYSGVLVIITADEASEFPVDELQHENMVVWVQTLRPGVSERGFRHFPLGYPPDTRDMVAVRGIDMPLTADFFFSGQDTHERRHAALEALSRLDENLVHATDGFTLGMPRNEYLDNLMWARTAPCPSGPETQETFRMWEALQAGAIPILDMETPTSGDDGYWRSLFRGDVPLPVITDWNDVSAVISELVAGWPHTGNKVQAWWSRYRRQWAADLDSVLADLGGATPEQPTADELVTVLVPTSPVPSNPDTTFIEQTIESVRDRFPKSLIRVMVDGVRPEQWERTGDYQEYTRRLLWLVNNKWWNVTATVHDTHRHQAAMARHELVTVSTPLILYVEHDTPLVNDWPVEQLVEPLMTSAAHLVRMNHEHQVHPEHRHLLVDDNLVRYAGLPFHRTTQWSQRPHLARVDMYRRWLDEWFRPDERSMIEDRMHSVVQQHSWERHKILLFAPQGNQQRSIHTDARGTDPKWPNV